MKQTRGKKAMVPSAPKGMGKPDVFLSSPLDVFELMLLLLLLLMMMMMKMRMVMVTMLGI